MGLPSRQRFEFRLTLNAMAPGRRASNLPDAIRYRLDRELRRRAEMMGLRVYDLRFEMHRIVLEALLQPNMVKQNIERVLWGAINGMLKKEMPHLVKRTGHRPGPSGQTGMFF